MSLAKQKTPSGRQSSALDWHDVPVTAEFGGESPLLFMGFAPKEVRVLQLRQHFGASCFVEVV